MKHKILFNILITSIMLRFIFFPTQVHAHTIVIDESGNPVSELITSSGSSNPITDPTEKPGAYNPKPETHWSQKLYNIGKKVLAIINIAGVAVSVIALGIIGLRYIIGSAEEKAQYKEILLPYIIGIFLLGGGTTIINIIYNILT